MTPIYAAVQKENLDMVKLLLSNDKVAVNIEYIFQS